MNALIFGATSLIAECVARNWAHGGASLHLVARNADKLESIAADLRVRGALRVTTQVADLDLMDAHPALVAAAIEALGGLDVVLIAQGTLPDQVLTQQDCVVAREAMVNNGLAPASLMGVVAEHLGSRGEGSLVVIGSVAGDRGRASNYVYGAAKALVERYAEGLQHRFARTGVRVLLVKPGFVRTPMTAHLERSGALWSSPQKVAALIVSAVAAGRRTVYVPGYWRLIMLVIRFLPHAVFSRLKL